MVRVRLTWTMGTGQPTSASSCWAWGSVQASSWGDTLDRGHHTQAEAGIATRFYLTSSLRPGPALWSGCWPPLVWLCLITADRRASSLSVSS